MLSNVSSNRRRQAKFFALTKYSGENKIKLGSYCRPPDKTDEDYLTSVQSEFLQLKKKSKNAIFILGGDFNVPDIDWTTHKISGTSYPQRVSQTFLDITMELGLEQLVDFPTRLENTLDLIFTSHPSFKIRCKPLPPIGQKSDHDIVLLDTAHQPLRARLPRRKIFLWKRADAEKIKQHLKEFSHSFIKETSQSVECMWTLFKSAITSAVEKHVPTKMSSTRQTHPWVNTSLRRAMRRKQRAHWRAKKTKKHKYWNRYKKLQAAALRETRTTEKIYMEEVESGDLKQKPKRFYSYIKSKRQESEGVSSLIDKNGFLQSDSTKRAEVLNDQFVSAYTKEDTERLPSKWPSPFSAMRKIIVIRNGVTKLLRVLKPHKASGPDSIPTYILKVAADEISPVLTKIFQTSLDTDEVPADWRKANIVPLFKKGDKHQASNYRPVSLTSVTCKVLNI